MPSASRTSADPDDEDALASLYHRYSGVVYEVRTTKGMEEARKARAELRGLRTSLEAKRKEIKAPALERCRLIDDEAKRITGELSALEDPIDQQIKSEEDRKAAEKEARDRAERDRIAGIQAAIGKISAYPMQAIGKSSNEISDMITTLRLTPVDETFGEFAAQAVAAKGDALDKLVQAHDGRLAQEEDAARLKAEREEFARQQAEEARRRAEAEAADRQRREADEATAKAARAEEDACIAAERAEIERQRQALAQQQADAERRAREEREAEEARIRAEREEVERQRRELEDQQRRQREAEEARARAEAEAAEQARIASQTKTAGLIKAINDGLVQLSDAELEDVLQFVTGKLVAPEAYA